MFQDVTCNRELAQVEAQTEGSSTVHQGSLLPAPRENRNNSLVDSRTFLLRQTRSIGTAIVRYGDVACRSTAAGVALIEQALGMRRVAGSDGERIE